MKGLLCRVAGVAALFLVTGCATAVDLDSVNGQLKDHDARIKALEKAQAGQGARAETRVDEKIAALQGELDEMRKDFADSRWTVNDLSEKVEAFKAYMDEVEQFMTQYRKKGTEIDKALEEITNRLEADVRGLAEKLRKMLDEGAP